MALDLPAAGDRGWSQKLGVALADLDQRANGSGGGPWFYVDDYYGAVVPAAATPAQNVAALNAALAAADAVNGVVIGSPRVHEVDAQIVIPDGVMLMGAGSLDYNRTSDAPTRGFVLRASTSMPTSVFAVLKVGSTPLGQDTGTTIAAAAWIVVDANSRASYAIHTYSRRAILTYCQAWRGTAGAGFLEAQNGYTSFCVFGQNDVGNTVYAPGVDGKLLYCQIRGGLTSNLTIATESYYVIGNHLYSGGFGTFPLTTTTPDIIVSRSSDVLISGNTIEGTNGPHVHVTASVTDSTAGPVNITGNNMYQTGPFPDNTHPVVLVTVGSTNAVQGLIVNGNTFFKKGDNAGYTALVEKVGTGPLTGLVVSANSGMNLYAPYINCRPEIDGGNTYRKHGTATQVSTVQTDRATATGDGSTVAFSFPHRLAAAPRSVQVTPSSAAAAAPHHVTADATNITITYTTAPAGSAALSWDWHGVV